MRARTFISILILVLAVMVIAEGCASKPHKSKGDEVLYGTWVNEEYHTYGKYIYNPDGTGFHYHKATDQDPSLECRFTIEERWTDVRGNTYYKVLFKWDSPPYDESTATKNTWFILFKFDKSGDAMETVGSQVKYPEEVSPIGGTYLIHYRQE